MIYRAMLSEYAKARDKRDTALNFRLFVVGVAVFVSTVLAIVKAY